MKVAQEIPSDVAPAPVAEVVSTRTPAKSELRVLARRAQYFDPNARAPSMPRRDLSPATVPFDPDNPDHSWRVKHLLQSPGPPEPEPSLAERVAWAKGELLLKSRRQKEEEAYKHMQIVDPMDAGFRTTPTPQPQTPTPAPAPVQPPEPKRRRLDPSHEVPKPKPKPKPKPPQKLLGSVRRNRAPMRNNNKRRRIPPHLLQARKASAAQNTRDDHAELPEPSPIPVPPPREEAKQAEPIPTRERSPSENPTSSAVSKDDVSGREATPLSPGLGPGEPQKKKKRGYRFELEARKAEEAHAAFVPIPSAQKLQIMHADSRDTKAVKLQDRLF